MLALARDKAKVAHELKIEWNLESTLGRMNRIVIFIGFEVLPDVRIIKHFVIEFAHGDCSENPLFGRLTAADMSMRRGCKLGSKTKSYGLG